jgi:NADPH:quinone reductase-like Zn-dependent oxidoreductase
MLVDCRLLLDSSSYEGLVLFAGPLAGSEQRRLRVLLIIDAEDEAEIERRLADDPWLRSQQLLTTSADSWAIVAGAVRLALALAPQSGGRDPGALKPRRPVCSEMAALVASGQIEIPIAATYPLERVRDAFAELEERHAHGKIVLLPRD